MLFIRNLRRLCSTTPKDYLDKYLKLTQQLEVQNKDLDKFRTEVKDQQKLNKTRNQQVHDMRIKLTKDVQKGEQIWLQAKKKTQNYKKQAIKEFGKGLIQISQHFKSIKQVEEHTHPEDLKQGFELTSRLFFNTLEKYKIVEYNPKEGDKFDKNLMEITGEEKTNNQNNKKGTIAKVVQKGWLLQGNLLKHAKIIIYN